MPREPVMMPGLVGEDVAEEVFGENDIEVAGDVHEVHGHGVDELVFYGDGRGSRL